MNKAVPWHVKGVGFDAREIAHRAARRAGLPVGEWLNSVITDTAQDLGVAEEDFSEDERLDALVARLAGVAESVQADDNSERGSEAAPRKRVPALEVAGDQPMSQTSTEDDGPEERGSSSRRARHGVPEAEMTDDGWWMKKREGGREGGAKRAFSEHERHYDLDEALDLVQKRADAEDERVANERQRLAVAALAKEVEKLSRVDAETRANYRTTRRADLEPAARRGEPRFRDAVGSVAERIEELEARLAHRDADLANRPIVAALGRLEDRFEHLLRRNSEGARESARVEATFRRLDGRLHEISQRLDRAEHGLPARSLGEVERIDGGLAAALARLDGQDERVSPRTERRSQTTRLSSRPGTRDAVADITQRQMDLDQGGARRESLLRETSYPSIDRAQRETRQDRAAPEAAEKNSGADAEFANLTGLQDAFARLTARMEKRLEEVATARNTRDQDEGISALKSGIAALGERLDAIRQQNEDERAAKDERADVDVLRGEIAALQQGLSKLAPKTAIATLEEAVRTLGGQIDESRGEGVSEALLAPLDGLRQEVRQAVENQGLRTTVDRVEHQLREIGTRLERIESRGADDRAAEAMQGQIGELRELMRAVVHQSQAAERLEVEIGELGARVERLVEMPPRSSIRDLELAVNEIRTRLVEFAPGDGLQDVSVRLGGLDRRLDQIEQRLTAPAEAFDALARRVETANQALAERLLKAMPGTADVGSIETMIGNLSGQLDGIGRVSADMQVLGGLVQGLTAQIEEARLPNADARILDTLEMQVGRLAERLDRSDASLDAIASVERLVRELFNQVDETRAAAIDAAELAARNAAQETLRSALVDPAIAGDEASARATLVAEQVGQELSEFRKAQQASEKRVHSTLLALNETLERMVDRMVLGAESARQAPAQPVAPAQPAAELRPAKEPPAPILRPAAEAERATPAASQPDGKAAAKTAPTVEIGRPAATEPMPDVSPLIAAARRAAQAAQNSAAAANRESERAQTAGRTAKPVPSKGVRAIFRQKRRPVLLSVASVVLLLGALQMVRLSQGERDTASVAPKDAVASVSPEAGALTDTPAAAPPPVAPTPVPSPAAVQGATPASAPAQSTAALLSGEVTKTGDAAPATATFELTDKAPKALPSGLRDLADRGDPAAQYEVGARLAEGRGLPRDAKAAAGWFERSAKQGFGPAEYRIGSIYEKGNGIAVDAAQAVAWYEKAANQGNVRAMHNLAVMAAEGGNGKPDYARAAGWFTKAAQHGVRDSQYNLAILYARGLGLAQDLTQSYTWFSIAAAQGDTDAGKKRDDVAAKLESGKIASAKAAADSFKPEKVDPAANEVSPPPGGWDVASPAKGLPSPKLSSM